MSRSVKNRKIIVNFDEIENTVRNHYKIKQGHLWGTRRIQNTAEARQVFYYISFYINNCIDYNVISDYTGQTRPNVIRSVKKVESIMEVDDKFEAEVSSLYNYCKKHIKQNQELC